MNEAGELPAGEMQPFNASVGVMPAPEHGDLPPPELPGAPGPGCFRLLGRVMFQRLVIFTVYRIFSYINKLYQDVHAVQEYYNERDMYFCIISAACLFLPPLIYAVFLVGASAWLLSLRSASFAFTSSCDRIG